MKTLLPLLLLAAYFSNCSPKSTPSSTSNSVPAKNSSDAKPSSMDTISMATLPSKKNTDYVPPVKTRTPKKITVNDKAATRTTDGRYYYDLEGKRYWRNKKDGKYYLYYKGMFENKNFQ